jgi:hypothetical protein
MWEKLNGQTSVQTHINTQTLLYFVEPSFQSREYETRGQNKTSALFSSFSSTIIFDQVNFDEKSIAEK